MPQCIQRVPYIAIQWANERSNPSVLKAYGRIGVSQIHVKENSKIIWPFAHIPMYSVLGVKLMYIRDKGFKSRVWKFKHVFRDDLGNIKGTKMFHAV